MLISMREFLLVIIKFKNRVDLHFLIIFIGATILVLSDFFMTMYSPTNDKSTKSLYIYLKNTKEDIESIVRTINSKVNPK